MFSCLGRSVTAVALLAITSFALCERVGRQIELNNNGHRLHLTLYAPKGERHSSSPTVVFESGLGGGERNWRAVIEQLPPSVPAVTYGRPGMDGSEPDGVAPSPEHIATILHAALGQIASPPYVLVGHSWGGPLIRAFAGIFPGEIAGLVFVDPTDFNETATGRKRYVFAPLGHADDGEVIHTAIEEYYSKQAGQFDPPVQAEIDASREGRHSDFASLKALPMPQVPIVLVATTHYPVLNDARLPVPFDQQEYQALLVSYRLLSLSTFARSVPEGTLVTTSNSGHYIQLDEPPLVSWAIDRVLHPSVERRLTSAFESGGLASMRRELSLIESTYPVSATDESTMSHLGDNLMRAGKQVEAVSLLTLNQKAHPSSSMAAADLADAELANGDKASALENYRLAIRFDGSNSHAHEQVNALSKKQNRH